MREYTDFINDIKNAIMNIESFVSDMDFEQFEKDTKTYKAVIRCLEEIGEGAKNIIDDIREKYPKLSHFIEALQIRYKYGHL